ncbi:unnamed protein product [Parnassius mnemosyne]|uniref:Uncharacterized protein n=1 Tax=Parnassius mnemosyne TaxID=213953 RepID=A0AAV1LD02_9NEOP
MKKKAKKEESYKRMHRIQTGGGPANPKKEDPLDSKILSLIKTSAVGLFNRFDSDSVAPESLESHNFSEVQVILSEEPELCSKDLETDTDEIQKTRIDLNEVEMQDWSDYTPKMLRTPVATPLQYDTNEQELKKSWSSRRRPTYVASTSSLQKLHEKKIEAIDLQKSVAEKESLHLNAVNDLDLQIKREQLN